MKCENCKGTGVMVVGRGGNSVFMVCPTCDCTGRTDGKTMEKIDIVEYLRQRLDHKDPYYDMVIEYIERLVQFEDLNKVNNKE